MIRRNKRLRREYLYRKTIETAKQNVLDKKKTLQQAINGKLLLFRFQSSHYELHKKVDLCVEIESNH